MPAVLLPLITEAAIAAPAAAAATTAAAALPAAAATTAAAALPAAAAEVGTTAALATAKQAAIQQGMQQAAQAGIQQTAQQAATEAAKQGIMQGGQEAARNQVMEAFKAAQAQPGTFPELGKYAGEVTSLGPPAGTPPGLQPAYGPAAPLPPAGEVVPMNTGITQTPLNPMTGAEIASTADLEALKASQIQAGSPQFSPAQVVGSGAPTPPPSGLLAEQAARMPPNVTNPYTAQSSAFPNYPPSAPTELADIRAQETLRRSAETAADKYAAREAAANINPLEKGFDMALKYVKENPVQAGLGLMSVGQYMNKPEPEKKKEYKSTVDMSKFQPSVPSAIPFTPSYQYQRYAVGGPVEQMSAMNAVGDNTMYPQSQFQTPMYSNPMIQRPMPSTVISQGLDAPVDPYSGEQKLKDGGISEEEAREYGLKTRKQRAVKGLSQAYEDIEKERAQELASTKALGDRFDKGIVPRSRTQMLSSPYSAAQNEFARLAKKNKVPVAQMPKTSLGDIDSYMETPIEEAAGGGIMGDLGSYSDGGRLLRGPGDGVSDSIPAVIGKRQPARLADGEFVIPARIVSELGNGSTEAGARKLYAMMERIQNTRKKSIGKKKVAVNSRADKHLPA